MRALAKIPHPDQIINRIQDGIVGALNPLLRLLTLPDDGWTDAMMVAPWTALGADRATPGFRRDSNGWVHLRGFAAGGTNPGVTVACVLPPGYRPRVKSMLPLVASSWNSVLQASVVDVFPTGEIKIWVFNISTDPVASTPCNWLSLDGLSFLAEQ